MSNDQNHCVLVRIRNYIVCLTGENRYVLYSKRVPRTTTNHYPRMCVMRVRSCNYHITPRFRQVYYLFIDFRISYSVVFFSYFFLRKS